MWVLMALLGLGASRAATPGPLLELTQAQLQALSPSPQAVQEVTLPYRVYREERVFSRYRMALRFDAPAELVATRTLLALDSWPDGGRIVLNGAEVADVTTSSQERVVRHLRPFGFTLPAGLLRERGNLMVFEWGSRETLVLLPRPAIGPREQLEPLIERKLFWEHTVVPGSTVIALVIFLVTGAVWWQQRTRDPGRDYALFVVSAFGWIVFNTALLWSTLPAPWFPWRRAVGFFGMGMFAMGMWMGLARLARWRKPLYERICWGWIAFGPLLVIGGFFVSGDTHLPRAEALWAIGGALLGSVPLVIVPRAAWREPSVRGWVMVAFVLVAVMLAAREAMIYIVRDPIGTVHLGLQLLAPLWLALASGVLVQDFVRSLRESNRERAEIDRLLAEREAELARLHQREREHAAVQERHRIMQDMHDGLGSQLVSSLSMAERGLLTPVQTAELLRGCIDDLRLAIDTLTEVEVDLPVTAGNLRFRMEPRLRAAGLRVRWDMQGLPDELRLPGTTALPLLRVLQEALANAIKHASARTLQVRLAVEGDTLVLEVADDGRGYDIDHHAPGKGLAGMHKRARALGADLALSSDKRGSRVTLRLPLPPATGGDAPPADPAATSPAPRRS